MIELASRIPVRITPGQTVVVAILAAAVLLALAARSLLEAAVVGVIVLILRLIGHRPPRKSSFSTVLDEFEAHLHRKDRDKD